ncbi:MAG: hypothetical protein CR986_06555 [Ignavibacteriae bacterium]|nr:MAG: hypothetical protein CR986_06555 [Ignavibacteriota bacterium]
MNKLEQINVIEKNYQNKLKIKGSQFLGFAYKINSADDAMLQLGQLKKEHYDATHHCYAYKTTVLDEKYSDDGEPNGTAGIRIFNAIKHFDLTNIIVVVVRYFGGTKLGIGPLGKAYGDTAHELLSSAKIENLILHNSISIKYTYNHLSSIHYLLNKYNCKSIRNLYKNETKIECLIKPNLLENFSNELIEKTNGQLKTIDNQRYQYIRNN